MDNYVKMMHCKICGNPSNKIFTAPVLDKYPVDYHQCNVCKFIQPDDPFWLNEAYSSAITSLDIGLVTRNQELKNVVHNVVYFLFNKKGKFIDYGGGYGLLVRMLRDRNLDFYRQDKYCENLFAKYFDETDAGTNSFELLTSFEVFEHLEDPIAELEKMFSYAPSVLFSTVLQPESTVITPSSWWYVMPEIGQHISLFSEQSLKKLAEKYNKRIYSNKNIHLITDKKINKLIFWACTKPIISGFVNFFIPKRSLLMKDFNYLKAKLFNAH